MCERIADGTAEKVALAAAIHQQLGTRHPDHLGPITLRLLGVEFDPVSFTVRRTGGVNVYDVTDLINPDLLELEP